jgi:hypothetical protein
MDPRVEQLRLQIDEFAETIFPSTLAENTALPVVVRVTVL